MAKPTVIFINKGEKGDPGSGSGAGVAVQPGAPASPATGTLWFDTDDPAVTPGEVTQHAYAEDHGVATANADNASALNTLLTTYQKVEFRSTGTFLAGQITVPAGKTLIIPAGVTVKRINALNNQLVLVSGRLVGDGTIDGNAANQGTTHGTVYLLGSRSRVKDVYVTNNSGDGVTFDPAADHAQAVRVRVDTAVQYGIQAKGDDQLIDRCEVSNTQLSAIHGQGTSGSSNKRLRVVGCVVDQTAQMAQIGIELYADAADIASGATVTGCTIRGGYMGISFARQQSATASANTITGFAWAGMELASSRWCAYTANTIDGVAASGVTGISCSGTTNDHNALSANTIRRCTAYFIHCNAGSQYTITGNTLTTGTASVTYGIWMQETPKSAVTGNQFDSIWIGLSWSDPADAAFTGNSFTAVDFPLNLSWGAGTWDTVSVSNNTMSGFTTALSISNSGGTLGSHIVLRNNPGVDRDYLDYANTVIDMTGTGTPEGVVTAGIGSVFRRRDGTTGTTLYKKQTGAGATNTGWVAS